VPSRTELESWKSALARLRSGPAPRGETFDLCRRLLSVAPGSGEALQAARTLLEGAMADAATPIADAQVVMRLLRSLDRSEVQLSDILQE
jgi:hypothetical protein